MLNGSYFAATILSSDPVEHEMFIFIIGKVLNLKRKPPVEAMRPQDNSPPHGFPSRFPAALFPLKQANSVHQKQRRLRSGSPQQNCTHLVFPESTSQAKSTKDDNSDNQVVDGNHPVSKKITPKNGI